MYDLNSKNVTDDPVQIPDQLDEVAPLTPVQIFVKEEQSIRDQLDEVVPLTPVQIFLKEEEDGSQLHTEVPCKTEEPVFVSLLPVLPKEEHMVDEWPDDFEEGSGPLVINLENSSSEDWSNHSDPLAIAQNEANVSYVEYVETSEPILMDLGAASTEVSSHPLRIAQEAAVSTVQNGELYHLTGSDEVVQVSENHGDTDGDFVEVVEVPRVATKTFPCMYCKETFPSERELQAHVLSHAGYASIRRVSLTLPLPELKLRPKPVRTLRAQHTCGDCGESFGRLEQLMRHRFSHLRNVLRKPFSEPKQLTPLTPRTAPKQVVTQPREPAAAESPRALVAASVSTRTSPKRSAQQSFKHQPKRWSRRKKTRRRWASGVQ